MKKSLSILALSAIGAFGTTAYAQYHPSPGTAEQASIEEVLKYDRGILNVATPFKAPTGASAGSRAKGAANGVVLAETWYDLQTNAAIDNRTQKNSDGSVTAAYTFSATSGPNYTDRGTGYSYKASSAWTAKPTARIENERTGWPSIMTLADGSEVVISHSTANDRLYMSKRSSKGSGTWTHTIDPTKATLAGIGSGYLLWPRAVAGGKNGNTIHMIALTEPTGGTFSGSRYGGMNGALLYNRSKDGGTTWDIKHLLLPGIDTTAYDYIGGDNYSISAKGDVIAIAVYHRFGHVTVMKSTDNGDTWTTHRPLEFRYNRFNLGDYLILDSVVTSDNTGDVIIDNSGKLHVFFGSWRWKDDNITDSVYTVYRFDNGLHYWREDFGNGNHIRLQGLIDQDGNPNGISFVSATPIADYGSKALNSAPSGGIDANGNLYVLFHGVMEDGSNGPSGKQYHFNNLHYRHQFAMKSTDGGCTWGSPIDLTNAGTGFEECVYGAMAPQVDSKIRFTYMEDINPGTAVGPVAHTNTLNEIVYVETNVVDIPNDNHKCATVINGDRELCLGDSIYLDATPSCGSAYSWSTGAKTAGIWVKAAGVYKCTITTKCGSVEDSAIVTTPIGGIGPKISVTADDMALCPSGSSTVLRLSTSSIGASGAITWGTGTPGRIDTNVVNGPGTYSVEVTNCNGDKSNANITITEIKKANASVTGRAFLCPGDTSELIAASNPAGSYTWTFNSSVIGNNQSIKVTQTGKYSLLATACNSLYQDTTSVNVAVEPTPSANVTPQGSTVLCEKSGAVLNLVASGQIGATFKWNNGKTGSILTVNGDSVHTANYIVTSYNSCGDSIASSPVSVEVKTRPLAPVISFSNGVFTSNNASSTWYFQDAGNWVNSGVTGLTYAPTNLKNGAKVIARVTTNGCESDNSGESTFTSNVGIDGMNYLSNTFKVYPNPNSGSFNLSFEGINNSHVSLAITSVVGQVVYQNELDVNGNYTEAISLTSVDAGVYYITVNDGNNTVTKQIVIE